MQIPVAVPDSYIKHDGVLAVLTIRDGTVVEEAGSAGADTRMLAATLTLLLKESDLFAEKLGNDPSLYGIPGVRGQAPPHPGPEQRPAHGGHYKGRGLSWESQSPSLGKSR